MPEDGPRLTRIVIAVVIEEDYFATQLLLQASSRVYLGYQKSLREKSTRLLSKTYHR